MLAHWVQEAFWLLNNMETCLCAIKEEEEEEKNPLMNK